MIIDMNVIKINKLVWSLWLLNDDLEFQEEIRQEVDLNIKEQYPNSEKIY